MADPFPVLHALTQAEPRYAEYLRLSCEGKVARLIFWGDETVGGNVLSPGQYKKVLALWYTFADLPSHIRSSSVGWLPIGILPYKLVKNTQGGYSGILGNALKLFFHGQKWSFITGMRIIAPGGAFILKARFAALVQDWGEENSTDPPRVFFSGFIFLQFRRRCFAQGFCKRGGSVLFLSSLQGRGCAQGGIGFERGRGPFVLCMVQKRILWLRRVRLTLVAAVPFAYRCLLITNL